ncbi:MAG: helix-turn-helix domain-containing protein [Betaproteobacteria bacterium]|nr:helix-turn-helix domain-containing protein [Betaproteobacteria bacterium]
MNLKAFINQQRGSAASLSRELGINPVLISYWSSGSRPVPAERCPSIERATGGLVRCEDLRPDVEWCVLRNARAHERDSAHLEGEAA